MNNIPEKRQLLSDSEKASFLKEITDIQKIDIKPFPKKKEVVNTLNFNEQKYLKLETDFKELEKKTQERLDYIVSKIKGAEINIEKIIETEHKQFVMSFMKRFMNIIDDSISGKLSKMGLQKTITTIVHREIQDNLEPIIENVTKIISETTMQKVVRTLNKEVNISRDLALSVDENIKHISNQLNVDYQTKELIAEKIFKMVTEETQKSLTIINEQAKKGLIKTIKVGA